MSHGLKSQLRRLGAGAAAILLIAGAGACGGGNERESNSEERGQGALGALGGGNRSGDSETQRNGERGGSERGAENSSATARIGDSEEERSSADDFDRRVRIVNNSDQVIRYLRGSPVDQNAWGEDRIPTTTLAPGSAAVVDFDDNNGECRYDLRAEFADSTTREQRDVNICRVSEWIVTSSGSSAR